MAIEIMISVRSLVEFLLRSGDLDNRIKASPEDAMQAGARMHRKLQKEAGGDYRAEVTLRHVHTYGQEVGAVIGDDTNSLLSEEDNVAVAMLGRADGIYKGEIPDGDGEKAVTIDEIKTTYRRLYKMKEPVPVHLAQAKCYAYIYALQNHEEVMHIRMTYVNLDSEDIRYFYERVTMQELTVWFEHLMEEYRKWALYTIKARQLMQETARDVTFPYPYREGQRDLCAAVYRTIAHKKRLFLEAPTGTGKTIATVFPSVKAMGEGKASKLFYLTAKTITRSVAENTLELLRGQGLRMKSVVLTAKDKICPLEHPDCNPVACRMAKGHYDRINAAIYDLLTTSDNFNRDQITGYAIKHQVCPFEMSLDMSLFADVIICDYNYVFDPHVYLRRFFGEGETRRDYIFLVDEAHNLVDRGREMYSATLSKERVMILRRAVKDRYPSLYKKLQKTNTAMLALRRMTEDTTVYDEIDELAGNLYGVSGELSKILENENRKDRAKEDEKKPKKKRGKKAALLEIEGQQSLFDQESQNGLETAKISASLQSEEEPDIESDRFQDEEVRELLLDFFFEVSHFLLIYEKLDENYCIYGEVDENGQYVVKLFCMNPSRNLRECMDRGISTTLFSATLLPIQYYKKLLGGTAEDYEVYAHSVFDERRRALIIANDVTSKYARRSDDEYERIAAYIYQTVSGRHGNYMIFSPSYAFMRKVVAAYEAAYEREDTLLLVQTDQMSELDREQYLGRFQEVRDDRSLLGFAVLGGVFGEGIDLKNDTLIGVLVIGTGIPQVCAERELLKEHFAAEGENGYCYAYQYPGMNKVLQAAGRVIRTNEDVGVVALLDERFLTNSYRGLFPREWSNYEVCSKEQVGHRISRFWDEWL